MVDNKNPPPIEYEEFLILALAAEEQIEVSAIKLKTIEIRLSAVKEATHRSRFIFIVMTIVASAILITLWNSTLSWDSGLVELPKNSFDDYVVQETLRRGDFDKPGVARILDNRDAFISEWIKNLVVSVGLLGIRVSSTDLAVIGSASLLVVMTWYFYSQRRENRAIVSLLRDCVEGYQAKQLSRDVCYMVFQGIVHSIVFIDLGKGDAPLSGLGLRQEDNKPKSFVRRIFGELIRNISTAFAYLQPEKKDDKSTFLIRKVVKALVYLPPITILLIIASDIWSLCCLQSPLRLEKGSLWLSIGQLDRNKVYAFELFGLLSAFYIGYLCYLTTRFSKATADTLIEYEEFLAAPKKFLESLRSRGSDLETGLENSERATKSESG